MTDKPAKDLTVGDLIVVDGVPVDIIAVDQFRHTVCAKLSDDPGDYKRWPHDAIVQVVGHFEAVICI